MYGSPMASRAPKAPDMEAAPYPALSQGEQRPTTPQHERLELQIKNWVEKTSLLLSLFPVWCQCWCLYLAKSGGIVWWLYSKSVWCFHDMFSWCFQGIFKCQVSRSALTTLAISQLLMRVALAAKTNKLVFFPGKSALVYLQHNVTLGTQLFYMSLIDLDELSYLHKLGELLHHAGLIWRHMYNFTPEWMNPWCVMRILPNSTLVRNIWAGNCGDNDGLHNPKKNCLKFCWGEWHWGVYPYIPMSVEMDPPS